MEPERINQLEVLEERAADAPARRRGPRYRLLIELQRRRVCRTALSYSLLVWLNVQIGDVFFPMAGIPEWPLRLIVLAGLMGLPLVVYLAWTFQITPRGVRVDTGLPASGTGPGSGPGAGRPLRAADTLINLLLLVLGVALVVLLVMDHAQATDDPAATDAISAPARRELLVALSFHSSSQALAGVSFVRGLEVRVRHELMNVEGMTVVADALISSRLVEQSDVVLVSGSFRYLDNQLHAIVDALDIGTGRYLWTAAFEVTADSGPALQRQAGAHVVERVRGLLPAQESVRG